jgi:hypothetical protein
LADASNLETLDFEILDFETLAFEILDFEILDFETLAFFVVAPGGIDLAAGRTFLAGMGAAGFDFGFDFDRSLRVIFDMIRVY